MTKRARPVTNSPSRRISVQRAAVKRAQQPGKRQAEASARRTAGASQASAHTPHMPRTSQRKSTQAVKAEVSVPTPYGLRRAFVLGISVLALGLVFFVAARNVPGWQQFSFAPGPTNVAAGAAGNPLSDSAAAQRIGLVSGHRANDSGAVCQDGLTEAEVNFDTAVRVAELLRAQGYTVDVLDEFDTRLKGYRARALVSIHADSCAYINDLATGFKVARVLDSKMPEEEDRLVSCLKSRYAAATDLRFHANTVTRDMTEYHAFSEVDERTPAAIIEIGFLYLDRQLLTRKPELVAQGVVDGILCFVDGEPEEGG